MSQLVAPESASDLTTAPFVVLRTPLLPADVLSWWSNQGAGDGCGGAATRQEYEARVQSARTALATIEAWPMRYETLLADNGLSLSGGQRQRLAIARAVAREPKILVLDEATSHLDAVTEGAISRNLRRLRCTQIIVAHRLSTIRHADQILVMEAGRIVERGQHDALMARLGVYAALFSAQVDGTPQPVRETHARS